MPDGQGDNGVEVVNLRQQAGPGPSRTSSVKSDAATRRRRPARRWQEPPTQRQDVIDLTEDRPDDDDVQITRVKTVKRPRLLPLGNVTQAALAALASTGGAMLPLPAQAGPSTLPMLGAMTVGAAALPALAAHTRALPGLAAAAPLATTAAPPVPPNPPSPKGYKCTICLERMQNDLATTTCGHMFCFKCISAWVQKSGNCPQCRSKLAKTKIIRIYPPS